jgi:hypothetical protein
MLLLALMLAACGAPPPASNEEAHAPGTVERTTLCLPVRSEEEIFREARERNLREWVWRGDIADACVRAQARILARGTDSAPVIADAALAWCEPHENLAAAAAITNFTGRPQDYTVLQALRDPEFPTMRTSTQTHLRDLAIREVLQARAGGCYEELVQDSKYSHSIDTRP